MVRGVRSRRGRIRAGAQLSELFDRRWMRLVAIVFAIEVIALIIASVIPLPQQDQSSLLTVLNNSRSEIMNQTLPAAAVYIFTHNLGIATLEVVPGFGFIVFSGSTLVTGLTLGAEAASYGVSAILITLLLFTLPSTWFELSAYAIAVVANVYIVRAIFRGTFRAELGRYFGSWIMLGSILLLAAILESAEIRSEQANPFYAYLVWIPAGVIILLSVLLIKRKTNG